MTDKEIVDWIEQVGVEVFADLVRDVENSCRIAGESGPFPIRYIFRVAVYMRLVPGRERPL